MLSTDADADEDGYGKVSGQGKLELLAFIYQCEQSWGRQGHMHHVVCTIHAVCKSPQSAHL